DRHAASGGAAGAGDRARDAGGPWPVHLRRGEDPVVARRGDAPPHSGRPDQAHAPDPVRPPTGRAGPAHGRAVLPAVGPAVLRAIARAVRPAVGPAVRPTVGRALLRPRAPTGRARPLMARLGATGLALTLAALVRQVKAAVSVSASHTELLYSQNANPDCSILHAVTDDSQLPFY